MLGKLAFTLLTLQYKINWHPCLEKLIHCAVVRSFCFVYGGHAMGQSATYVDLQSRISVKPKITLNLLITLLNYPLYLTSRNK